MPLDRVVVCDDDDGTRAGFVAEVNAAIGRQVAVNHTSADLKVAINTLLAGQGGTLFDGADVVVIDNRLIDEWKAHDDPKVSAEQLSDLVRTSTTAAVVVVLNQYRELDFDLRLDGRLESYADLNITDKCLAVPGLWRNQRGDPFRPWSWPVLETLPGKLGARADWLLKDNRLDVPILTALGLSDDRVARSLSRVALDFLHAEKAPPDVTFRDFVQGASRATDRKDRDALATNNNLVAKIAASRIGKWLETTVLGPQEVLIDVPHLLERYPCLVDNPQEIDSWNAAIGWTEPAGFRQEPAAPSIWPLWDVWLTRPAYIWALAQDDPKLSAELASCYEQTPPLDVAFCEDVSSFLPVEATRDFVANFDSAFDRRHVKRTPPPGFVYGPASRFAR